MCTLIICVVAAAVAFSSVCDAYSVQAYARSPPLTQRRPAAQTKPAGYALHMQPAVSVQYYSLAQGNQPKGGYSSNKGYQKTPGLLFKVPTYKAPTAAPQMGQYAKRPEVYAPYKTTTAAPQTMQYAPKPHTKNQVYAPSMAQTPQISYEYLMQPVISYGNVEAASPSSYEESMNTLAYVQNVQNASPPQDYSPVLYDSDEDVLHLAYLALNAPSPRYEIDFYGTKIPPTSPKAAVASSSFRSPYYGQQTSY